MTFKIGRLVAKNSTLDWKSFRDDFERVNRNCESSKIGDGNSRYTRTTAASKQFVNSILKKDLSVMTPSINQRSQLKSMANSMDGYSKKYNKTFHIANPNPQGIDARFKGVRDVGYEAYYDKADPLE